jgi:hypothetical protein
MIQAVAQSSLGIFLKLGTVQRLQEKILEIESYKALRLGFGLWLGIDQLELMSLP